MSNLLLFVSSQLCAFKLSAGCVCVSLLAEIFHFSANDLDFSSHSYTPPVLCVICCFISIPTKCIKGPIKLKPVNISEHN